MRYYIVFIALLFPMLAYPSPDWFYNSEPASEYEILGYGVSDSLQAAKENAINEIVQSISVSVKYSFSIQEQEDNSSFTREINKDLSTQSNATITGVNFSKIENIQDKWYVLAKFDNSPLEVKIANSLPKGIKGKKQNKYLSATPLIRRLNDFLGVKLDFSINRKNNLWFIKYESFMFPLSQENIYELFADIPNSNFEFSTNKWLYSNNENIFYVINIFQTGYISILSVERDGKVGIVLNNFRATSSFKFPMENSDENLTLNNPYHEPIKEMYVAVYSERPIDFGYLEEVSDEYLDSSNYNFSKLLQLLNDNEYSTKVIKIK